MGIGVLKMYPTFLPSEQGVVKDILLEAGLKFPADEGKRPWNPHTSESGTQMQDKTDTGPQESTRLLINPLNLIKKKVKDKDGAQVPSKHSARDSKTNSTKKNVKNKRGAQVPLKQSGGESNVNCTKKKVTFKEGAEVSSNPSEGVVKAAGAAQNQSINLGESVGGVKKKQDTRTANLRSRNKEDAAIAITPEVKRKAASEEKREIKKIKVMPPTKANATMDPTASMDVDYVSQFYRSEPAGHRPLHNDGSATSDEMGFVNEVITNVVQRVESETIGGDAVPLNNENPHHIDDNITKEEVIERAKRYAASLTVDSEYNLGPPPVPQSMAGLYYLLHESPKRIIVERNVLHDPDTCMRALEELEHKGELEGKILESIGPWVAWREAQVIS